MMYLMARSTALDLDWVFDNDLARFGDPWNEPRTQTGRKSIVQPIGPALVWTPLIWTRPPARAVVDHVVGADIPLHGYTLWTQRFVFLSSALFGCARGAARAVARDAARCGAVGRRVRDGRRAARYVADLLRDLHAELRARDGCRRLRRGHRVVGAHVGRTRSGGAGSCSARCSAWRR